MEQTSGSQLNTLKTDKEHPDLYRKSIKGGCWVTFSVGDELSRFWKNPRHRQFFHT